MYELHPEVQAQLIVKSVDARFVIAFPKSKSQNFQAALSLAKLADTFEEIKDGKSIYYLSSFEINLRNVSLIKAIMDLALFWKGVHIFLNGQPVNRTRLLSEMLGCFRDSFRATDKKAYCFQVVEDVGEPQNTGPLVFELNLFKSEDEFIPRAEKKETTKWIHPCKLLANSHRYLSKDHPASLQSQLQAQAVKFNCDICPNFNAENLKKLEEFS